jgi:hypothetical protein
MAVVRTFKAKVVQIPATATQAQIETALETALSLGWILQGIYTVGSGTTAKYWAIFTKRLTPIV